MPQENGYSKGVLRAGKVARDANPGRNRPAPHRTTAAARMKTLWFDVYLCRLGA
jgi:hypothetical protein